MNIGQSIIITIIVCNSYVYNYVCFEFHYYYYLSIIIIIIIIAVFVCKARVLQALLAMAC